MKQRTILKEKSIRGKTLHTGEDVELVFKPAAEDHGIAFKRVDLYGKPEIRPGIDLVTDVVRSTTVTDGHVKLTTIEHVLSALNGVGIDNVLIEINGSEPPILDGSSKPYVELLKEAGFVEQAKERKFVSLETPISVMEGNRSLIALPYDGFKITCTSADDRGFHTQHLSLEIDSDTYMQEIASARTFTIYEDIEELLKLGKIRGGSLDSAIVIRGDKILSKEPLRYKDEFVRHKILDIIGDVSLLGSRLKAHIIAVRPGHALNAKLTRAIIEQQTGQKKLKAKKKEKAQENLSEQMELDIQQLLNLLPHRYPFFMIDRVLEVKSDSELIAVKNVTINEPYFQGHFPGNPMMPGVMQIEAMAQAAGVLLLRRFQGKEIVPYFMSCDKVKFRRAVKPGDRLEISVTINKLRETKNARIASANAVCKVDGEEVSSAELLFSASIGGEV